MEEKNDNNKLHIIIMILLFIIGCGAGYIIGTNKSEKLEPKQEEKIEDRKENSEKDTIEKKKEEEKDTIVEEQTTNRRGLTDKGEIEKLDEFVSLAMEQGYEGSTNANLFMDGKEGLTKEEKELMVYFSTDGDRTKITKNNIPNKYKDDVYWMEAEISTLPIKSFKDEYKRLFKEDYVIEGEDYHIGGCPFVFLVDEELGYMYYSNQCGGTGVYGNVYDIYKYEQDDNYYYVYQHNAVYADDVESNKLVFRNPKSKNVIFTSDFTYKKDEIKKEFEKYKDKFEALMWVFDKDINFIKTVNMG